MCITAAAAGGSGRPKGWRPLRARRTQLQLRGADVEGVEQLRDEQLGQLRVQHVLLPPLKRVNQHGRQEDLGGGWGLGLGDGRDKDEEGACVGGRGRGRGKGDGRGEACCLTCQRRKHTSLLRQGPLPATLLLARRDAFGRRPPSAPQACADQVHLQVQSVLQRTLVAPRHHKLPSPHPTRHTHTHTRALHTHLHSIKL